MATDRRESDQNEGHIVNAVAPFMKLWSLTASYMTTETSGSLMYSSLGKAHVLKAQNVLSFVARHTPPSMVKKRNFHINLAHAYIFKSESSYHCAMSLRRESSP